VIRVLDIPRQQGVVRAERLGEVVERLVLARGVLLELVDVLVVQGLSRIYLRGIYPGIISLIIRIMGLDDIFGFEYAFLSERIIILQTAQAANYIVFSGDLLYSSISDWHGVSHVWRRFSAGSRLRRRRNASEEW